MSFDCFRLSACYHLLLLLVLQESRYIIMDPLFPQSVCVLRFSLVPLLYYSVVVLFYCLSFIIDLYFLSNFQPVGFIREKSNVIFRQVCLVINLS